MYCQICPVSHTMHNHDEWSILTLDLNYSVKTFLRTQTLTKYLNLKLVETCKHGVMIERNLETLIKSIIISREGSKNILEFHMCNNVCLWHGCLSKFEVQTTSFTQKSCSKCWTTRPTRCQWLLEHAHKLCWCNNCVELNHNRKINLKQKSCNRCWTFANKMSMIFRTRTQVALLQ